MQRLRKQEATHHKSEAAEPRAEGGIYKKRTQRNPSSQGSFLTLIPSTCLGHGSILFPKPKSELKAPSNILIKILKCYTGVQMQYLEKIQIKLTRPSLGFRSHNPLALRLHNTQNWLSSSCLESNCISVLKDSLITRQRGVPSSCSSFLHKLLKLSFCQVNTFYAVIRKAWM